uniref:Uncharacterized protein n=1 Tax=Tanacetum cinerariifolium TaxID=118510 RepID=A0A6L2L6B3_TANCI|nr:hypothetical protein [Tanacetum cinerariifolium]
MIREALPLDDAEGVDCLLNEEIFTELARMCMSTKRTSWNEFSSSMASAVICLSSGDLSTHTTKYTSPALTQKVFANMRRVGKGFSGVETPLFKGMLVEQEIDVEEDADEHVEEVDTGDAACGDVSVARGKVPAVQQTPPQLPQVQPPSPQPQPQPPQAAAFPMTQDLEITKLKIRVKKLEKRNKGRMIAEMDQDDAVVLKDDKEEDKKVDDAVKDVKDAKDETEPAEFQKVVDVVTTAKLITEVVTAASETVTAASAIITTAEAQVPTVTTATLTASPVRVTTSPSRRRKGVVIRDPKEESTTSTIILAGTKSKDKAIDHVKRKAKADPVIKKYQAMQRKPQTEAQAKKNIMMYLKNVAGFKLDYFKGMSYDDICPIFQAKFNSNVAFLLKIKEQIEEDKNRALQTINETPAESAAKRRKLDEVVEDLKRHLHIVPNEDDDVYTEATPLAGKVPVVDYEIIEINNKPYYKIIRADGTH